MSGHLHRPVSCSSCNAKPLPRQPNCKFNVDANSGHAFGILLAAVGALRPAGSGAS
jgi:hypothetical protein